MALRYVNTASTAGGDGTTNATSGANRAYASLSEWEAARMTGTLSEIEEVICEGSAADTTLCIVAGATTSSSFYPLIRTDTAGRHDGKWNTAKYRLSVSRSSNAVLEIQVNDCRVSGLQAENTDTGNFDEVVSFTGSGVFYFEKSILRCDGVTGSNRLALNIGSAAVASTIRVYNNIIYGFITTGSVGIFADYGSDLYHVYNNTVYGCTQGFLFADDSGTLNLKNNIANGNTTDYVLGSYFGTIVSAKNISEDTSSPNSAYRSLAVTFVNEAGKDFHLSASDTAAKDAGDDLSVTFTDDIDFTTRSGTWDIGADEIASVAAAALLFARTSPGSLARLRR